MTKKILLAIAGVVLIVLVLVGVKAMQINTLISAGASMMPPPEVVSAQEAKTMEWELSISAVGTAEAAKGVTITADLPGRVAKILFTAGTEVKSGDLLLEQDIDAEQAQLRSATATRELAKKNLDRIRDLLDENVVSQAQYDAALAEFDTAVGQEDNLRTNIEKRQIRAPFDGRLGIRQVNLGQDINEGQAIVTLQSADLMYVNFSMPQRYIKQLRQGLEVRARVDSVQDRAFIGKLTAISPEIDSRSRSVQLQATFDNADETLLPGMFAKIEVILDETLEPLVIPATAIAYATFGDSVFVLEQPEEGGEDAPLVARQQFVRLGKTRGDFIEVKKGINAGDLIAITGVFKLQNGAPVTVNNEVVPEFKTDPDPKDS